MCVCSSSPNTSTSIDYSAITDALINLTAAFSTPPLIWSPLSLHIVIVYFNLNCKVTFFSTKLAILLIILTLHQCIHEWNELQCLWSSLVTTTRRPLVFFRFPLPLSSHTIFIDHKRVHSKVNFSLYCDARNVCCQEQKNQHTQYHDAQTIMIGHWRLLSLTALLCPSCPLFSLRVTALKEWEESCTQNYHQTKRCLLFFFLLATKCCTFPLPDHILVSSLSHANQQKRPTLGSVFLLSTLLANWNSLYSKQPATLYLLVSSWRVKWIVKSICRHIWLTHNHCTNEHNKVLNRLTEKNQTVTNAEVKKYSAVS